MKKNKLIHILIIPSEPYRSDMYLASIFQKDQAEVLFNNGYNVGALSIYNKYSLFTLFKAFLYGKLGKIVSKELTKFEFFKWFLNNLVCFRPYIINTKVGNIPTVEVSALHKWNSSNKSNQIDLFIHAGNMAYKRYINLYGIPDLIHAHNVLNAGFLAEYLSKKHKIPFIITEHNSEMAKISDNKIINRVKRVYNESSTNLVVSPFIGEVLLKKYELGRSVLIPNILDKKFEEDFKIDKPQKNQIIILNVASLIKIKDQETLLRGFKLLSDKFGSIKLRIIGDGILKENLMTLSKSLGIYNKIVFLGARTREEILEEIRSCSFLTLTSKFETFGVVLIEAISQGKPVLSSNCGGPKYIVNKKNGKLFRVGDYKDFAFKATELIDALDEMISEEIRNDCIKKFGSDSFIVNIGKIYNSVINNY